MPEKQKHWFEFQTGGAQLGFAQWVPVRARGWLTFLGMLLCWLGGPYLLDQHSTQFGVWPGLTVLATAFALFGLAIRKTKRMKFD